MTEALLGLLILTASYLITLVAAGGGAVWTRSILRKHVIPQSDSANVLWKIILTVVLLPILAFIAYLAYIYALYCERRVTSPRIARRPVLPSGKLVATHAETGSRTGAPSKDP